MLHVNDLNVSYGQVQALHDVSLTVNEREAVAVLGANGAGKSTLINSLIGWQRPNSGEVTFEGRAVTHLPSWDHIALGMGFVPEGGRVFRDLSVRDNLRLGAYLQDEDTIKEQMVTVFELFPQLADRQKQIAKTLSGGEQQMLALGRAMMSKPRILLIDEVSMGLMPILVKRVFNVFDGLKSHGVSILLVEQNAFEALKVVDRAYVLENGHIVLEGTPDELRQNERVKAAYLGG